MIQTLRSSFLALLVSALFVMLVVNVEAVPIARRRSSGMFSLPLKRMERTRDLDVHPQIVRTFAFSPHHALSLLTYAS